VDLDQLLEMFSAAEHDKHKSTIPPLDCDHPMFYWIFKNADFVQWSSASYSQALWLSGPPERNIHQVSSYIVDQEKNRLMNTQRLVLYFFCSAPIESRPIVAVFIRTLLSQIVCSSPRDKRISIVKSFLRSLYAGISKKGGASHWKELDLRKGDSLEENIEKILQGPSNELWAALRAVLADEKQRELFVVVDGLDKVEDQKVEFLEGVRGFVTHLLEETSKAKILLTSRPQSKTKEVLNGLPCIEYDKERIGWSAPYILLN
jgi:ankyrin repeat domain-containing protein 50